MTLKRRTSLPRSTRPIRKTRLKPKARSAAEFRRIYGSRARVSWVKSLHCLVSWCREQPSENHHIENGGTGRKADFDKIVPMCLMHHDQYHDIGRESFERVYHLDLRIQAAETERLWSEWQTRGEERE